MFDLTISIRLLVLLAGMFLFAGHAYAGDCTITLTVQTATGATVTGSAGNFSIAFGNINGLGVGTLTSGITVSNSGTGATYTTPVTVKTVFSSCSGGLQNQVIKVYQNATTSAKSQAAAREGSAAGSVVSVPTTLASATTIRTVSGNISNQTLTRFVGLFVSNANGAGNVTGALAPKIIYVVTVN
ncbi:MAG TPA: hypothetical protein VGC60_03010 [Pyrinomonadaceae bacterium]|jgi:hypothetical protein